MNSRYYYHVIHKVTKIAYRILFTSLVIIVTHSGLVVKQVAHDLIKFNNLFLTNWTLITGDLLGTFNFITLYCDPTIRSVVKHIDDKILNKKLYSEDQNSPTTDTNGLELQTFKSNLYPDSNYMGSSNGQIIAKHQTKEVYKTIIAL